MRTARSFVLSAAAILAAAIDVEAKILSLDDRCRCTREWADHAEYVRCVKRNAKRYLRFEARFDPNGRRRLTRRELRAAARARVAEAVASRCGIPEYLCDADRPCAPGEVCDVRDCEETLGVCVPTPESCPTGGTLRCTCGTETDPLGRAYANDCERLRAGAKLNTFGNPPYTKCRPSCGGAEGLACPEGLVCLLPDRTCGMFDEHGACDQAPAVGGSSVCGCDGTTYPTRDAAARAGARVAYPGECGAFCGGPTHLACQPDEYCLKDWGVCDRPDVWGNCRAVTNRSCLPLGPVCGCDGRLYPRACDAVFAGTDVADYPVDGACAAP